MRNEPRNMRWPRLSRPLFVPVVLATAGASLFESHAARAATDAGAMDLLPILAGLVLILVGAKLGGALFESA